MQVQRNLAKQELIYDLLFGNQDRKTPIGSAQRRFAEAKECVICLRDKLDVARASKLELNSFSGELLCIDCKRGLFSFEGFKYQCKQVKSQVSTLERLSVVLNEQMGKLRSLISKERLSERPTAAKDSHIPDWCNRDIPSKFGKGGDQVNDCIQSVSRNLLREEESRLSNRLQTFHEDLLNLQETVFTFISVLEAYIETPWTSVLKDKSYSEIQPCVAEAPEDGKTHHFWCNTAHSEKEQTNEQDSTTAQRIERIRKQQEKVRQQIKALYGNTMAKDIAAEGVLGHALNLSLNSDNDEQNLEDAEAKGVSLGAGGIPEKRISQIADYFLFESYPIASDGAETARGPATVESEAGGRGSLILKNYDILWSPSSSSSPSSPRTGSAFEN